MKEIWRNIVGYEGLYQVSNFGRVKNARTNKIRKLKQARNGYIMVDLCKNGKYSTALVHRLVAQAFIPNPQNLPVVNHRDEDKTNNFVFVREDGSVDFSKSNLEWCTQEYNTNYGTGLQRRIEKLANKVSQYNMDGTFMCTWKSAREAAEELGVDSNYITSCCSGKTRSAYGFIWKYTSTVTDGQNLDYSVQSIMKPVRQYTTDGIFVREWKSVREAGRYFKTTGSGISACCKGIQGTACNFQWRYSDECTSDVIEPIEDKITRQCKKLGKKVRQYTLDGTFVREYPYLNYIEKTTGLCAENIAGCCRGKQKTAYGYRWEYVNP